MLVTRYTAVNTFPAANPTIPALTDPPEAMSVAYLLAEYGKDSFSSLILNLPAAGNVVG